MDEVYVSIIIPFAEVNEHVRECVKKCRALDYDNYEIMLLPDGPLKESHFPKCRIIPTGEICPAAKRNTGVAKAKGEIFAFIDADAYPSEDWLKKGVAILSDESIGILGGPNLTPPADDFLQKLSGSVLGSAFGSGNMVIRYSARKSREADILPSCNMMVHRRIFDELGHGWDESIHPGEDTKLCLEVRDAGKKVWYSGEVLVYHHRRRMGKDHFVQIWDYGRVTGETLKRRKKIERPLVLVPPLFLLWLIVAPLFLFIPKVGINAAYLSLYTVALYLAADLAASLLSGGIRFPLLMLCFPLTHISYAAGFWAGYLPGKYPKEDCLKEKAPSGSSTSKA